MLCAVVYYPLSAKKNDFINKLHKRFSLKISKIHRGFDAINDIDGVNIHVYNECRGFRSTFRKLIFAVKINSRMLFLTRKISVLKINSCF